MPTSRDRLYTLEIVSDSEALPEISTDQGCYVVAIPGKAYKLRVSAPRVVRISLLLACLIYSHPCDTVQSIC